MRKGLAFLCILFVPLWWLFMYRATTSTRGGCFAQDIGEIAKSGDKELQSKLAIRKDAPPCIGDPALIMSHEDGQVLTVNGVRQTGEFSLTVPFIGSGYESPGPAKFTIVDESGKEVSLEVSLRSPEARQKQEGLVVALVGTVVLLGTAYLFLRPRPSVEGSQKPVSK